MNSQKRISTALLGCGLIILLSACSGVKFSPTDLNSAVGGGELQDKTGNESFYPNPVDSKPQVDVLFVIDNSASMRDEQLKLGDKLSSFLGSLKDVDWQIGITTTDTSDSIYGIKGSLLQLTGRTDYILTKNTPNYAQVFASTVVRPEGVNCGNNCPSKVERPLEAVVMAMAKANTENKNFFRKGAELAVVVLSDADEGGNGLGSIMTPQTVLSAAYSMLGEEKRLTGFAIVIEPGDKACLDEQLKFSSYSVYGFNAALLAALTGGVTGSICETNFAKPLEKIGERVLNLVSSVTLKHMPVEGSVQVTLTPSDATISWKVKEDEVEFNKPPQPGTRVDIKYTIK